jgi:hypothetical protein
MGPKAIEGWSNTAALLAGWRIVSRPKRMDMIEGT